MVQLLGFQITRQMMIEEKSQRRRNKRSPSVLLMMVQLLYLNNGYFGQYLDMEVTAKNDVDLIKRYREIAQHPECDMAIEDIINEVIVSDERDNQFHYR